MLFNSYEFIFGFLPITFFLYFYLTSKRLMTGAKGFLVFASLFFYSWWNIVYLPLILASMLFNYSIGSSLTKEKEHKKIDKKSLLIFGIVANLLLLGYYKYANFFIENIDLISGSEFTPLNLLLPLGISFFTFTQIAYLVDSYRGETKEYDLLNYGLFVTFFPHLLAGPILHHKEMMPQFDKVSNLAKNYKNIALGIFLFSIGLFKKVVIADTFAVCANNGFDVEDTLHLIEAWATSLSYTFQLYFDFSGYTDMALGVALLFNIVLPINFNSPYKAKDIQDFWRRWHITLSRFLRDYIYIPLGGNRVGSFRIYSNLLMTFILGGLWHGAGWTFIFWGFLHGLALVIHRIWSSLGFKLWNWLAWFITFNFINISWIFFRAEDWEAAMKVLGGMFGTGGVVLPLFLENNFAFLSSYGVVFEKWLENISGNLETDIELLLAFIFILLFKNSNEIVRNFKPNKKIAFFIACIFVFSLLSLTKESEFLYFNF
ncbi:MAG: MBOAT family protein [Arcobacteraceae bacterium]|nr:MBOAT family protein [Arcobacteraceae bacterium]